jgi:DNA repair exonuclease SbcCD nuclease subunit
MGNETSFSFVHLADCHLGSWREESMRKLGFESFSFVIDFAISHKVDFVLLSGDLFNTALPSIDILKDTFKKLHELAQAHIPLYYIAGSHDYSPNGKTMLDIIEQVGLGTNVLKAELEENKLTLLYTVDQKTHVKVSGILGRANALEKTYFALLDREKAQKEAGKKVFLFHTALHEISQKQPVTTELSLLPKNHLYYAGGHVHTRYANLHEGYGWIVYPGPTFPNNFAEIEELNHGSFAYVTVQQEDVSVEIKPINLVEHVALVYDANAKNPLQISQEIQELLTSVPPQRLVTLRIRGTLSLGAVHDIVWNDIQSTHLYALLKNTSELYSKQSDPLKVSAEKIQATPLQDTLMLALKEQKRESETQKDFEKRIVGNVCTILGIKSQ